MTFEQLHAEMCAELYKPRSEAWRKSGAGNLPRVMNMGYIALLGSMDMVKEQFARHRRAVEAQQAFVESPAFATLSLEEQMEVRNRLIQDACMGMMP